MSTVLSEIRQTEDNSCMASLMCGLLKKNKVKLIEMESKKVVVRGAAGVGRRERLVKGYTFSAMRRISSEDLMDNMVTTVDTAVLYN